MNEYEIKKGQFEKVEGDKLEKLMADCFGNVEKRGDKLVSSFGALENVSAWLKGKTHLCVVTRMNTNVTDEVATETIRMYNKFLEGATGFTAKERSKRANKKG
jgi:hypothetical protein